MAWLPEYAAAADPARLKGGPRGSAPAHAAALACRPAPALPGLGALARRPPEAADPPALVEPLAKLPAQDKARSVPPAGVRRGVCSGSVLIKINTQPPFWYGKIRRFRTVVPPTQTGFYSGEAGTGKPAPGDPTAPGHGTIYRSRDATNTSCAARQSHDVQMRAARLGALAGALGAVLLGCQCLVPVPARSPPASAPGT